MSLPLVLLLVPALAVEPIDVDVVVPTAPTPYATVDEVLAALPREPDVATVQGWAAEEAHVAPEVVRSWLRGARTFALLPQLRVEARTGEDWSNDFAAYDAYGNPVTSVDTPADNVLVGADVGHDRALVLRATWDLQRLVMSSERLRAIDEARDAVRLRDAVLADVTRLYFERRRLQVDLLLAPAPDVAGRVRDELRLRELTAGLDALTGGRFSAASAPP